MENVAASQGRRPVLPVNLLVLYTRAGLGNESVKSNVLERADGGGWAARVDVGRQAGTPTLETPWYLFIGKQKNPLAYVQAGELPMKIPR